MNFILRLAPLALTSLVLSLGAGCSTTTAESAASSQSAEEVASFVWPTPKGWSVDSIPFPLSYAPELAYTGVEELRFAPGFFDPTVATYWSFSFAWVLDGAQEPTAESLNTDLTFYYAGLANAVDPKHYDVHAHHADVKFSEAGHFQGVLGTVDMFGDGRALSLTLVGETFTCGTRRIVLASLSPQSGDNAAVWGPLQDQRHTFQCAGDPESVRSDVQ